MTNEFPSNALSRRVRTRDGRPPQVVPQRGTPGRGPVAALPATGDGDSLTPKHLIRGLLHHLMTALVLGTLVGAGSAVAAWCLTPALFEAKALIQVKSETPKLIFNTIDNSRHDDDYARTQMQLITSDVVVLEALAKPGVADVELFKTAESPRVYLGKHLKASNSGSRELVALSLSGEDPRGLAVVVNAICDTYMDEIVEVETNHRLTRKANLERGSCANTTRISAIGGIRWEKSLKRSARRQAGGGKRLRQQHAGEHERHAESVDEQTHRVDARRTDAQGDGSFFERPLRRTP